MKEKEQPKRLGRGLAALLGDAAGPVGVNAPGVQAVAVDLLEPSPFQPRRDMDESALGELADSIASRGILQPLLVRPHPAVDGRFQIIAGERRWRAAQRASLHEVPVLVRPLTDTDAMAAGLVENLQREDLNAVEEAEGYQRLIQEFRLSQEALGEAVGKSRAHVNNTLRVLRLPQTVLDLVRDGSLTMGHARALLGHPEPEKGARLFMEKGFSVRQAEDYINKLTRAPKNGAAKPAAPRADSDVEALAETLSERLGLKVKISYNGKSGAVTLAYASLDQLDGLLALLNR
ncbi:MAG: chromosome partitioning protein ParB [Rhodospirillales bacterium 20-64-7]|nr:MAG: chromosome partitioning protein ParB [Rhodospirillales bacterium 20-64-7]